MMAIIMISSCLTKPNLCFKLFRLIIKFIIICLHMSLVPLTQWLLPAVVSMNVTYWDLVNSSSADTQTLNSRAVLSILNEQYALKVSKHLSGKYVMALSGAADPIWAHCRENQIGVWHRQTVLAVVLALRPKLYYNKMCFLKSFIDFSNLW